VESEDAGNGLAEMRKIVGCCRGPQMEWGFESKREDGQEPKQKMKWKSRGVGHVEDGKIGEKSKRKYLIHH